MRKQLAIVIDTSGSMYVPAGADSAHDKIQEASESVQFILEEIKNRVRNTHPDDEWAVSLWRFASGFQGLVGQTLFDNSIQDFTVDVMKDVVSAITDQASNQAAVGNLTDIFAAMRQASDWMEALPPTWPSFPPNDAPDKRSIIFFTDGNQTIPHNASLERAGYEAEQGVSFTHLLADRDIVLNTQGIGSDLLNATLTDLVAQAAEGSSAKVIAATGGYEADVSAALMTNAFKAVNDNGVLALRPADGVPSGLLWEQFSLPVLVFVERDKITEPGARPDHRRLNHRDFLVEVDGISQELILGLTWHHDAAPSVQATSPSGAVFTPGVGGAYQIAEGWMSALHIPDPEPGSWRVRVTGDPQHQAVRLNLMARGINPAFDLWALAQPFALGKPGAAKIIARPRYEGKPAQGAFRVTATVLGGTSGELQDQGDGSYAGELEITRPGVNPVRIDLQGKLKDGRSVRRMEFTTVQLGPARDPRLFVSPHRYQAGGEYDVEVLIRDGRFDRLSQIRFGDGIRVREFRVLGAQQAQARIAVSPTTWAGERAVVTFHPEAEGLTGVTVVGAKDVKREVPGRIACLRFDDRGRLTHVVMDDGQAYPVAAHDERLQLLLEGARDENQEVRLTVDRAGRLCGITICS